MDSSKIIRCLKNQFPNRSSSLLNGVFRYGYVADGEDLQSYFDST